MAVAGLDLEHANDKPEFNLFDVNYNALSTGSTSTFATVEKLSYSNPSSDAVAIFVSVDATARNARSNYRITADLECDSEVVTPTSSIGTAVKSTAVKATTSATTIASICQPNPCTGDDFVCDCDKGYAGRHCDVSVLGVELRFSPSATLWSEEVFRNALLEALVQQGILPLPVYGIAIHDGYRATVTLSAGDAHALVAASTTALLRVLNMEAKNTRLVSSEEVQDGSDQGSSSQPASSQIIVGVVVGASLLTLLAIWLGAHTLDVVSEQSWALWSHPSTKRLASTGTHFMPAIRKIC